MMKFCNMSKLVQNQYDMNCYNSYDAVYQKRNHKLIESARYSLKICDLKRHGKIMAIRHQFLLTIQKRQKLKYLDHEIKLTVKIITHLVLKIPNTITMGELFMCCTNFW